MESLIASPCDTDFDSPGGEWLGVLTAAYSIGAVISLPPVPWVNDRFGRKACLLTGTLIMITGSILQGAAVNGESGCTPTFDLISVVSLLIVIY